MANDPAVEARSLAQVRGGGLAGSGSVIDQEIKADEDNRLSSNETWIKWTKLKDGSSLKYDTNWYEKPGDGEDMQKRIRSVMTKNDRAKGKRLLEGAEPKRAQIKYADAIDRVKHIKKWGEWVGLEYGTDKT